MGKDTSRSANVKRDKLARYEGGGEDGSVIKERGPTLNVKEREDEGGETPLTESTSRLKALIEPKR